jgi:hypothetical protein
VPRALFVVSSLLIAACGDARDKPAAPTTQQGQRRAQETLLYVDGKARASLGVAELPAAAGTLCELLAAIELACPSLRAVHLHRVDGIVQPLDGDRERVRLEAAPGTRPRVAGVEVSAVAVYQHKQPPALPVRGIAYLDEPVRGGTRVNVDGRLAARMKRNLFDGGLTESADESGEGRYRFSEFLRQQKLGVPRAVELVTAEEGIVRVPDAEVDGLRFSAEFQKHGQMTFQFGRRAVSAVAVNLYVSSAAPLRSVTAVAPLRSTASRHAGFSAGCGMMRGTRPGTRFLGVLLIAGAVLLVTRRKWS